MRKRTAFQTPEDRKASPNQTKGLIAKGQKPGESVQEECVLDNLSHRTLQKLLNRPQPSGSQAQLQIRLKSSPPGSACNKAGWVEGRACGEAGNRLVIWRERSSRFPLPTPLTESNPLSTMRPRC